MEVTRAETKYLLAVYKEARRGKLAKLKNIANRVGVEPPSAVEALKKLALKGLVYYECRRGYGLTKEGLKCVEIILRKHRVLEVFMVTVLGVSAEEACFKASMFDIYVPEDVIDRICRLLNHPRKCPHGYPIPAGNCH